MKLKLPQILLFVTFLICLFSFLKTNSVEYIPSENLQDLKILHELVSISKYAPGEAISKLENIKDLGEYTDYKKNYILARLYEKKEDYKNAILIYEKIVTKNYPLKERIIFHLASLKAKGGDDKEALKLFSKLLRDFPYSKSVPQTKYYLAQAQFRLKLAREALNTLLSLRKEYPKTQYGIATNFYLGEYLFNAGNYTDAIKYFREYLRLSPDGRFANEIADLITKNNKINLEPSDYSLLGDIFFHKKDYENAATFYKTGNEPAKYYELGYSLFRINNKPQAINFLKEFAYSFPKSKNAKWALFYASKCLPLYLVKPFWIKVAKDLPDLAHYANYKEALREENSKRKEEILKNLITLYPNSEFLLDSVWEIMWINILDKKYSYAEELGSKYFNFSSVLQYTPTRAKIGFWLGKVCELTNQKTKAINYYKQTEDVLFDNYYSLRAHNRLIELENRNYYAWKQQNNVNDFNDFYWTIPNLVKFETIKNQYGVVVSELVSLHQFDEAIELIGKSKSPSKKVTVWLKALNGEYEASINIANLLANEYKLNLTNPIWNLAYPLHFWEYIMNICKNYPRIDPLLVCSLVRQESRFDSTAISISNAYGLMQLIPSTARSTARLANINLNSIDSLKEPQINIALGIKYLSGLIDEFNNPLFAVASYNAGPHVVKKWINQLKYHNDLDFFIEEIEYEQTKDYVKKVFASYWTYLKLYK